MKAPDTHPEVSESGSYTLNQKKKKNYYNNNYSYLASMERGCALSPTLLAAFAISGSMNLSCCCCGSRPIIDSDDAWYDMKQGDMI